MAVFDDLVQDRFYLFQALPTKVQYGGFKPLTIHSLELVRYLGDNDEGWHVFEKRDHQCIVLHSTANLFHSVQPACYR